MPSGSLLATMTGGGVSGSVALPTAVGIPSCLAVSPDGSLAAVGGWQVAPPLSGMAAAAIDPQGATTVLAVGSGDAVLWNAPGALSEDWQQTQALSGLADLNAMAWRPDGSQALCTDVVDGSVQVLDYVAGVLSLSQTLSVAGACSVAVAGTSVNAVVAQSGTSQLTALSYAGTAWSPGAAVSGIPSPAAVASVGPSDVAVAYSGGVAYVSLDGGVWSLGAFVPLGFAPSVLAVDPFYRVFAAGSGALAVVSGSAVQGSGSWTGAAPTAIAVQDGRAVMAVPSDGLFRIFGESAPGAWTQQGSAALSLGAQVGLALSDTVLFAMGSGATNTYGFSGTPFAITPVTSGALSQWDGSSWTTTALGIGHNPSAVAYDQDLTAWIATVQDTFWSVASGGAVLSSGVVPTFSGQPQTTPLGTSAIGLFGNDPFTNYNGTWDPTILIPPATLSDGNAVVTVSGVGSVRGAVRSTPSQPISELTLFSFNFSAVPSGSLQIAGICNAAYAVEGGIPGTDAGGNSIGFAVPGASISGVILLKDAPVGYAAFAVQGDECVLAIDTTPKVWLSVDGGATWNGGAGTGGDPYTSTGGYPVSGLAAGPYYATVTIASTLGTATTAEILSPPNVPFQVYVATSLAGLMIEIE